MWYFSETEKKKQDFMNFISVAFLFAVALLVFQFLLGVPGRYKPDEKSPELHKFFSRAEKIGLVLDAVSEYWQYPVMMFAALSVQEALGSPE